MHLVWLPQSECIAGGVVSRQSSLISCEEISHGKWSQKIPAGCLGHMGNVGVKMREREREREKKRERITYKQTDCGGGVWDFGRTSFRGAVDSVIIE